MAIIIHKTKKENLQDADLSKLLIMTSDSSNLIMKMIMITVLLRGIIVSIIVSPLSSTHHTTVAILEKKLEGDTVLHRGRPQPRSGV